MPDFASQLVTDYPLFHSRSYFSVTALSLPLLLVIHSFTHSLKHLSYHDRQSHPSYHLRGARSDWTGGRRGFEAGV